MSPWYLKVAKSHSVEGHVLRLGKARQIWRRQRAVQAESLKENKEGTSKRLEWVVLWLLRTYTHVCVPAQNRARFRLSAKRGRAKVDGDSPTSETEREEKKKYSGIITIMKLLEAVRFRRFAKEFSSNVPSRASDTLMERNSSLDVLNSYFFIHNFKALPTERLHARLCDNTCSSSTECHLMDEVVPKSPQVIDNKVTPAMPTSRWVIRGPREQIAGRGRSSTRVSTGAQPSPPPSLSPSFLPSLAIGFDDPFPLP